MSIEYGASSMLWMSKAVISQSDPRYVKLAVCELLDVLWRSEHVCVDEIFDRLVQVSTVGKYTAPDNVDAEVEEALRIADELIEKSIDEEVERFREILDGLPQVPDEKEDDE